MKNMHLCIYIVVGENEHYEEAGIFKAENTDDLCRQMLAKHFENHTFPVEKFLMIRNEVRPC